MRAAGLRETKSWALRLPMLLAITVGTAMLTQALLADPSTPLYGGAARGHRETMPLLFQHIFLVFAAGAALGGALSRVRVHTLVLFHVAAAFVAALAMTAGVFYAALHWNLQPGAWVASSVLLGVVNWAFPFAVLMIGAALLGRLAQRVVAGIVRRVHGPTAASERAVT